MDINGIAHVMLTVTNFEACKPFYARICEIMGLKPLIDMDGWYYCVGGRTALGIMRADDAYRDEKFAQFRVGLHHVCFRARTREDIDEFHTVLQSLGATIVHPPQEDEWAPGYYSVLFEDPDGIRLEMNYVPGRGHLDKI